MQLLRNKTLRFIRQKQLILPGEVVVVAVSGGADSVALLHVLLHLPGCRLQLVVAHLNHSLRGAESAGDEEFVRVLAEQHQLPCETGRVDVARLAAEMGLSLEEAGREARYAFFARVVKKHAAAVVATAHHQDDQAETVLMRLLRGAAGSGLAGIRPSSGEARVVRPFLCATRQEIESYLAKAGLPWREDESNVDQEFLRNRIRHQLLPLLKDYNPEIVARLNSTAEALAADEALLDGLTCAAFTRCRVAGGSGVTLDLPLLQHEPHPLRPRLYRQAIRGVKGDLQRISFRHLKAIEKLVSGNAPNGQLHLPAGITVTRSYSRLNFSDEALPERFVAAEITIGTCGSYLLPCGKTLQVEQLAALPGDSLLAGEDTIFLDPARVAFPWQVRYFQPGDRFVPLGMSGHKKLKKLFIDRKISPGQRQLTPLLLQAAEVVWVCGLQLAEKGRLTVANGPLIRVKLAYTAA